MSWKQRKKEEIELTVLLRLQKIIELYEVAIKTPVYHTKYDMMIADRLNRKIVRKMKKILKELSDEVYN